MENPTAAQARGLRNTCHCFSHSKYSKADTKKMPMVYLLSIPNPKAAPNSHQSAHALLANARTNAYRAKVQNRNNATSVEINNEDKLTAGKVRKTNAASKAVRVSNKRWANRYKMPVLNGYSSRLPARTQLSPSPHTLVVSAIMAAITGGLE